MAAKRGQKRRGVKDLAQLLRSSSLERVAKKLKVSPSTVRRWKREGVPETRREALSRAAKKTTSQPRNVRWRDESGRWRNRNGTFTTAPHRKKQAAPSPQPHAPPPPEAPPSWAPSTRASLHPDIVRPKPGRDFPRELLKHAGEPIGVTVKGDVIVLPSLEDLPQWIASKIQVAPKTVQKWIQTNRVPPDARDRILAAARGGYVYGPWESGRRTHWTQVERQTLMDGLRAFEEARMSGANMSEAHQRWRLVKDPIRSSLTKEVWRKLLHRVTRALGIHDTGAYSYASFKSS